jgi:hypothetical protein
MPVVAGEHLRSTGMATDSNTTGGGGNVLIGFLLGAVLVAVGIVGFFMWDNYKSHAGAPTAVITVKDK